MASALRILYRNAVLDTGVSVAASSSETGYSDQRLLSPIRQKRWRAVAGTVDRTVEYSLPVAITMYAISLVSFTPYSGGTVKIECWTGAAYVNFGGGTGLVTLPSPNRTGVASMFYDTGLPSVTKVRITFTYGAAGSAYVEMGLAYVAATAGYFVASRNVDEEFALEIGDPSIIKTTQNGQEYAWKRTKLVNWTALLPGLSAAQRETVLGIYDVVGKTDPVIFAVDTSDSTQVAYGRFAGSFGYRHLDGWHDVSLPFTEAA